jgi:hypothetical protein
MNEQINLTVKIQCLICKGESAYDLSESLPDTFKCRCGHIFQVSPDLALSLSNRLKKFLRSIPED